MGQQNPAGFTPDPVGFTPDKEPPNRTDLILANPLETPRDIPPIKSEIKPNSMFQNIMDWGNRSLFTGEDAPTPMDYFRDPRGSWERGITTTLTSPFAIGGELLGGIGLLKGLSKFRNAGKVAETVAEEVPKKVPDILGETPINPSAFETPIAKKPRFRLNTDGTATNLDTGEIVKVPKSKFEGAPAIIPKFGNRDKISTLPRELQGAKPRYNMGANSYTPQFANDVDKAMFIIAQTNKSKQDAAYLKFVMDATGLDEKAARKAGVKVRGLIKEQLKGKEPGEVRLGQLYNLEKPLEAGPAILPKFQGNKKGIKLEDAQAGFDKPSTLYHGTTSNINEFSTNKNKPGSNFSSWNSFSETPEATSLYSLGEAGDKKRLIPSTKGANTIPIKANIQKVLDLTKPLSEEDAKTILNIYKNNYPDAYHPELVGTIQKDINEGGHLNDVIRRIQDKLPYDAIKYNEHGQINWAVSPKIKKVTPWGVNVGGNVPPNNVPPSGGGNIPPEIPPIPNIHDEFMGRLENEGLLLKAASLMKGSKATGDLGPMFRQGIAYTGRPAWNKALVQQFKSFFSEGAHETFRTKLQTHPLMVKDAKGISEADRMGLYIPELGTLTKEEAQAGLDLTEKVWGKAKLGFIPRSSNRAFADSIASLRINVAQSLKERYGALYESMLKEAQLNPGKAKEILTDAEQFNPKNNLVLERIGEEVNSASGRGSLKIKGRSVFGQKLYGDINMGKYADAANVTLFSPRLIQSRLNTINRTLNPFSYLKQDPVMRKEHLKQLLSITGAITASDTLYSMFGGETGKEPTSSDFGKSRFGNITIDPTGGLGKYGTLEERLRRQELTSAQSKKVFKLGQNPVVGDSTTLLGNFAKGTISPAASLALEIISTGGRSFTGRDAIGQPAKFNSPNPFENPMVRDTVIPMIYQDIIEIIQEDPSYLPLIFPDAMGQGVNVFNKDKK